tara:strand:+ start:780 stop:3620 length:2841 start_codon:yes stop_codon:yes gene_type:complete
MANGPLGGFMPTPPSPGQPPQVKLETSAESRGNFNKFLETLPKNGAMTPIQTGVMQSSMTPVSPMTDNVNIFQPQMSQMTAMPMLPPAKPVQNFFFGGGVDDFSDFGGFDNPSDPFGGSGDTSIDDVGSEEDPGSSDDNQQSIVGDDPVADFDFNVVTTPTVTDQERQQNIEDSQTFMDTPISTPVVDTRPRTNIRNVGAGSNLRFDPQFTANLLQQRGLDPEGFMSPADFRQTTQGGGTGTAQTLTSALPSFGVGTGSLVREQLDRLRPDAGVAPVTQTAQGSRVSPTQLDFGLGLALDDPFGLGFNTAGLIESARDVQRMRGPQEFVQEARLPSAPTVVPGAGSLPSIDTIADDLVTGQGKGANINNPGNIRAGGGFAGEIGRTRDGFAIFDDLQSGVNAINTLTNTYGSKRNVDTVREYANRYSPVGENTAKEVAGKIDVLSNALGVGPDEKVDFTDPSVQAKLTPAVMTTEIGAGKTADVLNTLQSGTDASILGDLNLQQLGTNVPVTSDVNQLGTLDPIDQRDDIQKAFDRSIREGVEIPANISFRDLIQATTPGTPQYEATRDGDLSSILTTGSPVSGTPLMQRNLQQTDTPTLTSGLVGSDVANLATETQNISPENTAARIARNNRTINEIRADLGSRVPDTALETLAGRRDRLPDQVFDIDTRDTRNFVGDDFAPALDIVDSREAVVPGEDDIFEDRFGVRATVPDAAKIFGGKTITNLPTGTTNLSRGPDVSIVGDDPIAPLEIGDIQGDVTQERVADILNRPDRFKETFKIGDAEFPNLIATLANKAGSFFDRRLFDAIVSKGLDAVVDPDTGRIIGAKNEFGQLIEGRDLDQFQPDDEGDDPITTFLKKTTEDKKEEEKDTPPNVFGSSVAPTRAERPVVVESPFRESTASFTPVGFESGSLNDLIARITGVPSPRRMQDGGVINAVDNFLTKVA